MKKSQKYDQFEFLEDIEDINVREEIEKYLTYWGWFLIGLCVAFTAAFFYLK